MQSHNEIRRRFKTANAPKDTFGYLASPDGSIFLKVNANNKKIGDGTVTGFEGRGLTKKNVPPSSSPTNIFNQDCEVGFGKHATSASLSIDAYDTGSGLQPAEKMTGEVTAGSCRIINPQQLHVWPIVATVIACVGVLAICKFCGAKCSGCCNKTTLAPTSSPKTADTRMVRGDEKDEESIRKSLAANAH